MTKPSDPAQLEIIKNALEGIADGMALTLVRTSRSSVVRSSLDFSTAMLSAGGELVGQGLCMPIHLGGMTAALDACLKRYGDKIYPGDILAVNDPYEGGSHLPDIFLFKPLFVDDVLVSYACAMAHHTDIGGRVAGGNACDSTEIYQEGLRIPPLKLYSRGEPNETLFRVLEKAVRVPDKVIGDVKGQVAALLFGEQEILQLVRRYGVEEFLNLSEGLLDYTERLTLGALDQLPDGSWSFTDYLDDDGITTDEIPIVVNLTKQGRRIHVDFTGTAPQCKGALQPVLATTKAMVYSALRNVLGTVLTDIPNTSGYFRPVTVTAPEGTFVNPLPPAPVAARAVGSYRIHQTLLGAFAQMLPDKIRASTGGCELGVSLAGYDKTKTPWKPWVQLEFINEPASGGGPLRDGDDGQKGGGAASNTANIPVETVEAENPFLIEEFALLQDSEGAGKHRGGMGMVRRYRFKKDDSIVQVRSDRSGHTPYGLHGGESSRPTKVTVESGGEVRKMPGKFMATLGEGDAMSVEMPGAGGWGNPLEREPGLVLDDVIQEKVSLQRARDKYGVVIDQRVRQVDFSATQRLRTTLREKHEGK